MSIFKRLLGDAVVYSLTPLLSSLVGFLLVPIYTRTFTPTDYGALALVNTTTTFVSILVVFGLDNSSAIWFWDQPEPEERRRTWSTWLAFTTVTSLIFAVAALLLRNVLARALFDDERLSILWVLFAVNIVAANVARIGILWFRMKRTPWPAVMLGAVSSVTTAVFGIYFVVHLKLGLSGVIAGQIAGSWIGAIVALVALRGVLSPRRVDRPRLAPMLRLSAPLVLMTHLSWIMGGAVSYFVNFLCSREDAGLYQVANSIASIIGLVMFAFDQAWAPTALAIRDVPTARRVYGVTVEAAFTLGLLLAFGATAFATPALLIITHPEYVRAHWVLAILALNVVLGNVPSILSVTFAREKVTMPLAKATAVGAFLTVALLPVLAWKLGKEGAALAVLAGTVTILALTWRASQTVFFIDVHLRRVGVATLLTAGWVVAFLVTRHLPASVPMMIGHSSLLFVTLTLALAVLYRTPIAAAWQDARAAKSAGSDDSEEMR